MLLLHCYLLGCKDVMIRLRGDSQVVLQWAKSENFRSSFAINTSLLLTDISECSNVFVYPTESTFVGSKENNFCDDLSRGVIPSGSCIGELGSGNIVDFSSREESGLRSLALCDPSIILNTEFAFIERWNEVRTFLQGFRL